MTDRAHPFLSKGIFAWQLTNILKGNPQALVQLLQDGGFESLYVKVADGGSQFRSGEDLLAIVKACHEAGIAVVGWHFLYGTYPTLEVNQAIKQAAGLDLDGYIWDVESTFENKPMAVGNAAFILGAFRNKFPATPMAYCGWARYFSSTGSEWHPVRVATEFMKYCNYGMPMEYWGSGTTAADYLQTSIFQWRTFTDKPIVPVGRAYNGDGGTATPVEMLSYEASVRALGHGGISWWGLDWAQPAKNPTWWAALKQMRPFGHIVPVPPPPLPPEPPSPPAVTYWTAKTALLEHDVLDQVGYYYAEMDPAFYELVTDTSLWGTFPHIWAKKNGCMLASNGGAGWHTITLLKKKVYTYIYGLSLFKGHGIGALDKNWGQVYVDERGTMSLGKPKKLYTTFPFANILIYNSIIPTIDKAVKDYRARTAIGQLANGMIIHFKCDGGDYNQGHGMNFQEVAEIMLQLGCVFAVMLDGGGSSNMCYITKNGTVEFAGTNDAAEEFPLVDGRHVSIRIVFGHLGWRVR